MNMCVSSYYLYSNNQSEGIYRRGAENAEKEESEEYRLKFSVYFLCKPRRSLRLCGEMLPIYCCYKNTSCLRR